MGSWERVSSVSKFVTNKLSSLQKPYTFPFLLDILDLHSNYLQGDIPIPSKGSYILDYSNNNFGSSIPIDFGNFLRSALFFSIKNSTVVGPIPQSICNASNLLVLDLSHNSLSGTVPSCFAETSKTLQVLNLGKNNLIGNVLDLFPESYDLKTLDLSGNHLLYGFYLNISCLDLATTEKSDSITCSIIILNIKHGLQRALLWSNPTTLGQAFSLARIAEPRFANQGPTTMSATPNLKPPTSPILTIGRSQNKASNSSTKPEVAHEVATKVALEDLQETTAADTVAKIEETGEFFTNSN
ncbi:receptor-like protein 12 [Tanacetum coccineum]